MAALVVAALPEPRTLRTLGRTRQTAMRWIFYGLVVAFIVWVWIAVRVH